jgi:hypothetical protein
MMTNDQNEIIMMMMIVMIITIMNELGFCLLLLMNPSTDVSTLDL